MPKRKHNFIGYCRNACRKGIFALTASVMIAGCAGAGVSRAAATATGFANIGQRYIGQVYAAEIAAETEADDTAERSAQNGVQGAGAASNGTLSDYGIDPDKPGSIEVSVKYYPDGSTFRLYHVADLAGDMTFALTDNFRDADGVEAITEVNASEVKAQTLDEVIGSLTDVIREKGIAEDETAQIKDGKLVFTELPPGLYFITGDTVKTGRRTVSSLPALITVPNRLNTASDWVYDVQINAKAEDPRDEPQTPTPTPSQTPDTTPGGSETPETNPEPAPAPSPDENPTDTPTDTPTDIPTDTPVPAPSDEPSRRHVTTGDDSRASLYLLLMGASAGAFLVYLLLGKRHSKETSGQDNGANFARTSDVAQTRREKITGRGGDSNDGKK